MAYIADIHGRRLHDFPGELTEYVFHGFCGDMSPRSESNPFALAIIGVRLAT